MNVDHTLEALAQRIAARDPASLDELAAQMGARIHRLAQLILIPGGSAEDVEEVVSDVLAAAWQRIAEFAPDRRRLLQRKRLTAEGKVRVVPLSMAPEPVDPTSPEVATLRSERREAVRQALSQLEESDRRGTACFIPEP